MYLLYYKRNPETCSMGIQHAYVRIRRACMGTLHACVHEVRHVHAYMHGDPWGPGTCMHEDPVRARRESRNTTRGDPVCVHRDLAGMQA
jgi:hypothetical protein